MNEIILHSGTSGNKMNISTPPARHERLKNLDFENSGHTGFQKELTKEQLQNIDDIPLKANKEEMNNLFSGKVDKEEGKGLSSNDFTNEDKEKLNALVNYDDSAIYKELENINLKLSEKLCASNTLTEIKAPDAYPNMFVVFLDGKTQHYLINYAGEENDIYFEIVLDDILNKADEHTFYVYLKIASENIPSLIITTIDTSTGSGKPIKWLDTPTIEYPHTEMLLAFQTTDGGASWIANQCYSLEVK